MVTLIPYLVGAALGTAALFGLYRHVVDTGYQQCRVEWDAAVVEQQTQNQQDYLAALAWGNQISADLAAKQRQLENLKGEYLSYASAITGNCPESLGVFVASVAAGGPVPTAPRTPPDPSAAIAASVIAANVATNYAIARACQAQLNAVIDWHTQPQKDVK